jgi:hypothetical protein
MTVNKSYIENLRTSSRLTISPEQEQQILDMFGSEPTHDIVWSEQDIYEQIRKLLC